MRARIRPGHVCRPTQARLGVEQGDFVRSSATSLPLGLPLHGPIRVRLAAIVSRPCRFDLRNRLANSIKKMGGLEPRTKRLHAPPLRYATYCSDFPAVHILTR